LKPWTSKRQAPPSLVVFSPDPPDTFQAYAVASEAPVFRRPLVPDGISVAIAVTIPTPVPICTPVNVAAKVATDRNVARARFARRAGEPRCAPPRPWRFWPAPVLADGASPCHPVVPVGRKALSAFLFHFICCSTPFPDGPATSTHFQYVPTWGAVTPFPRRLF
jgi:hypothetical protein